MSDRLDECKSAVGAMRDNYGRYPGFVCICKGVRKGDVITFLDRVGVNGLDTAQGVMGVLQEAGLALKCSWCRENVRCAVLQIFAEK